MQPASRNIPLVCHGHSRPVPHLSYSSITEDGFFIVSACLDGKAMLRNGQTGDWVGSFLGHKGSADYTSKVWDTLTGDCKFTFEHKRIVKTVAFSQDGQYLATGGQEKLMRVFALEKPEAEPQVFEGHADTIRTALWQTPTVLLSGGQDKCIRVFDVRAGKEVKRLAMSGPVASMEITAGVLTVAAGKEVSFLDALTLNQIGAFTMKMELNSAALHPSRTRFVVGGSADFWDHVHDYATGNEIESHKGHHGPVHCVRYAPDGETFASGSEDGTIRLIQNEVKPYGLWQVPPDDATPAAAQTE